MIPALSLLACGWFVAIVTHKQAYRELGWQATGVLGIMLGGIVLLGG